MIEVLLNNEIGFNISKATLLNVVHSILTDHDVQGGEISLAIVDDPTIHKLNREHLQHDYPTDVLSFLLGEMDDMLEGEVIVSSDTANDTASEHDWSAQNELMLYFIHGCLHLVGYEDYSEVGRAEMREQEAHYLRSAGIQPPRDHEGRVLRDQEEAS